MEAPVPGGGAYNVVVGDFKQDVHGNQLGPNLFQCTYGALASERMIMRAPHANPPSKHGCLCTLEHSTILAVSDFIIDNAGNGCLVLESADESFVGWIQRTAQLFIQSSTAPNKVRLSRILRDMFLELASLIDKLMEENCCPIGLTINDLYIKHTIHGRPILKALLHYNVITIQSTGDITSAWTSFENILDTCCQMKNVTLDDSSSRFKKYFGCHKSARHLEAYPDAWSDEEKANYIFMIIHGDKQNMSSLVVNSRVDWPWDQSYPYHTYTVPIVEDIYDKHNKRKKSIAYGNSPWHYICLCRNVLKSFGIPKRWLRRCPDRKTFLRMMERWNPHIWTSLYEKIGPLGKGQLNY